MYYPLINGARLYRITGAGSRWPTPIQGLGAYYTKGGRYNRVSQPTVYCSEDPLVVIAETAFYQALDWQEKISADRTSPVIYPFRSHHCLWCFSINPAPQIIDLEHSNAIHHFQYSPHLLLNPSLNPRRGPNSRGQVPGRDYVGTQDLADEIRAYVPSVGSSDPRPEGIKVPSVRLRKRDGFRPYHLSLFVSVDPSHQAYESRSNLIDQWELELEFLQESSRLPINQQTTDIDWHHSRFRLVGAGAGTLPAYVARPNAEEYQPNVWYTVEIAFA